MLTLKPFTTNKITLKAQAGYEEGHLKLLFALSSKKKMIGFNKDFSIERKDRLWESTCFECFLLGASGSYLEFNVTPSGEWNCFYFSDYRKCKTEFNQVHLTKAERTSFEFRCHIPFEVTHYQLSAVLDIQNEGRAYYAFSHVKGDTPDFHDRDRFKVWDHSRLGATGDISVSV